MTGRTGFTEQKY